MRDSSINVEGISSPLLKSGPGQAVEAVVFVHVNPGSSNDWRSLAELVGSFARVIAMDMVGFGAADKPTNSTTALSDMRDTSAPSSPPAACVAWIWYCTISAAHGG